ncbi:hypothetical protein PR001_g22369 [Phytophthora rubi]|uniref:DDE-1 domain-containing protein n=1 Tax=Phytophthora rubi TaxID=129364 RepID=A0A6A3IZE2_9STRA|nr:hypothetical protein PR001_g22369 [Phytophthora rubi]
MKERATVMLLGDSDGVKCRPFVVFKTKPSTIPATAAENTRLRYGFGKQIWKDVSAAHQEQQLEIYGNLKGWWNGYLSVQFLKYHFGVRKEMHITILLLWDDFSGHWTEEVVSYAKSINVVLMKVPPSATSVCQPADVAWNYPFKARLRDCWVTNLRDQLRAHTIGKKFELKAPDRGTIARWIRSAWDGLSAATIANGYKKAYGTLLNW